MPLEARCRVDASLRVGGDVGHRTSTESEHGVLLRNRRLRLRAVRKTSQHSRLLFAVDRHRSSGHEGDSPANWMLLLVNSIAFRRWDSLPRTTAEPPRRFESSREFRGCAGRNRPVSGATPAVHGRHQPPSRRGRDRPEAGGSGADRSRTHRRVSRDGGVGSVPNPRDHPASEKALPGGV